jgi:hypothetical protein
MLVSFKRPPFDTEIFQDAASFNTHAIYHHLSRTGRSQDGSQVIRHWNIELTENTSQPFYFGLLPMTGKSVFISVNSTDACVFSQLMRMVQLPPV